MGIFRGDEIHQALRLRSVWTVNKREVVESSLYINQDTENQHYKSNLNKNVVVFV